MKFKLNEKTKKAIRGSISIMMVIILLPMMTFSAVIVDTSRINMAKQMMSSAGDLTMNTALANYDTILKDVYGLFAMSQEKTEAQLAESLKEYFSQTISGYGVVSEAEAGEYVEQLMGDFKVLLANAEGYQPESIKNLIQLENVTLEADRLETSALANSSILRNQIIEYMKFRAPLEFGMSFIDALKSFEVADDQMEVIKAQTKAQEGTQDVTTACSQLIKLIREYDDMVVKFNSGDGVVEGVANSKDGVDIPIKDYDTQVLKYLSAWGENYTHINKLMMVFLAKTYPISSVFLAKQNYTGGERFIKSNGTGVLYSNSGISISVSTSSNTSGARQQVKDQIALLNQLKTKAGSYTGKAFLNDSYINKDNTAFTVTNKVSNEDKAINTFIEYEKFLQNQLSDIKYSDAQDILQKVYTLGKYYDNYYSKISGEIRTAESDLTNAQSELARINNTINNIDSKLQGYIDKINADAKTFMNNKKTNLDFLDKLTGGSSAKNLLKKEQTSLSGTPYKDMINKIATALSKRSFPDKEVGKATLDYLKTNWSSNYTNYVKGKASIASTLTPNVLKYFEIMFTLARYEKDYANAKKEYNNAKEQQGRAQQKVRDCQATLDALKADRSTMKSSYETCLRTFKPFTDTYQKDAYNYNRYVTTATNIVNAETGAVSAQFGKICGNIKALTDKLNEIITQCGVVDTQIVEYLKKLESWDSQKKTYVSNNGSDSFSKQTEADIATARTNYDRNSLSTLKTMVQEQYNRFNAFNTYLQGDVYFKYGGLRLHEIKNAENAKTAAKNNIASISAPIITVSQATTSLGQLYKAGAATEFRPYTMEMSRTDKELDGTQAADNAGQLCFLEPITIQIQFLKYLNSSYPETAPAVKEGETSAKDNYEKTKADLKEPDESIDDIGKEDSSSSGEASTGGDKNSGGDKNTGGDKNSGGDSGKKNTVSTDKYGYSYKSREISGGEASARPSVNKVKSSSADNKAFALDANSKASDSVDKQGSALSSILSGLGKAVTAGIENAYILTYIFENFSYNTIIQDTIMEAKKDELGDSALSNLTKAKEYLTADNISAAQKETKTLSGFKINAANNFLNGAEIEYILFGNANPKTNVSSMKASIYAIRFAFNCIYAFTNTEIRNVTMAAGLAVQAATLGIVPYQVVQIVMQLAMAAAESAFDLNLMMVGLDVAVVKTKDTWMLGLKSALVATGQFVADKGAELAGKAIGGIAGGLQQVVDVSADKLKGAIEDVQGDVQESTHQAVRDAIDSAFGVVTTKIETVLNKMQYAELKTKEAAKQWISTQLTTAKTEIEKELDTRFGGSDLGRKVVNLVKTGGEGSGYLTDLVDSVKTKVDAAIDSAAVPSQAVEKVMEQLTEIKKSLVNSVTGVVNDMLGSVASIAKDTVSAVQGQLQTYINQASGELSEAAAKSIRDGVTNVTNNFVDNTLSKIDTTVDGGSGGKSLASMIKFGYKEYMMLFVYIGICAGGLGEDNKILLRTADVIQFNIRNAGESAEFKHKKKNAFLLKDACTYISVKATAELDMFFMDLDIFSAMLNEEESLEGVSDTTVNSDSTGTKITYRGLLGY